MKSLFISKLRGRPTSEIREYYGLLTGSRKYTRWIPVSFNDFECPLKAGRY